jgi:hypothetical protein
MPSCDVRTWVCRSSPWSSLRARIGPFLACRAPLIVRSWRGEVVVNNGEDLLEEMRQRRQAGDPRITPEGRAILRRLTTGDLAEAFADALAESSNFDRTLGSSQ